MKLIRLKIFLIKFFLDKTKISKDNLECKMCLLHYDVKIN